jgi:hypothetical protein
MQNFESYGLMGTSRSTAAPVPDTLADPELRRVLEEVRQRSAVRRSPAAAPASSHSRKPAPVVPVTGQGFERRPAGPVLGARGDVAWAMREFRNMDGSTLRSMAQADPEWAARVVANLDRLIAQLSGEQRANINGRSPC